MTTLRDLLPGYAPPTSSPPQDFAVYNTNVDSVSNGGRCCLWTVPAGITYAVFEMWSGGGSGSGGCCCMQGGGAGSGGYAVKGCNVVAGEQIRICAAGSGCCRPSNNGFDGYCTFVCSTGGGASTWESKVCGGLEPSITSRCNYFEQCYGCCSSCYCCGGRTSNVDFSVAGTQGSANPTQFCFGQGWQQTSDAPMMGGMRHGPGGCCGIGGSALFGNFPGGGGFTAQIYGGNCCCGGPGAGGAVYVVFY